MSWIEGPKAAWPRGEVWASSFTECLCCYFDDLGATEVLDTHIASGLILPKEAVMATRFHQLADEYDNCGAGFDQMVLDALQIDRDTFLGFMSSNSPTYPQLETWVLDQRGGSIPQSEIDASNEAVRGYNHADDVRTSILSEAGIPDKGEILDAVTLNSIEDWTEFHSTL